MGKLFPPRLMATLSILGGDNFHFSGSICATAGLPQPACIGTFLRVFHSPQKQEVSKQFPPEKGKLVSL